MQRNGFERERPPGGGVYWRDEVHVFECLGCMETIEVPARIYRSPEALAEHREMLELDHENCWRYGSVELARNARRYRKDETRRKLLAQAGRRMGWRT